VILAVAFCCALSVTAPADRTELVGGSRATIAWTADAPLPAGIEEWEAFLSVDGGGYYAMRITPHLDRDVRRFTFVVPNVASSDARILLRFGDERRETEVALPLRLRIRHDSIAPRLFATVEEKNGEAARENDPPVAAWIAGSRDGSDARGVVHRDEKLDARTSIAATFPPLEDAVVPDDDFVHSPAPALRTFVCLHRRVAARVIPPHHHDPLLATMRLNI